MTKNRKLSFLFGLCMVLLIAAVLSVNVSAKYTTTGGGSAKARVAKWGAKVEGEVIKEGDIFKYYKITAEPKGAEVASQIALKIDNLPDGVTPKLKKEGQPVELKYDANNTNDSEAVPGDQIIGKHIMTFEGLGKVAMFLQSVPGLIICVIIPMFIFIGIDYFLSRKQKKEKDQKAEIENLKAELAALKKEKADRDEEERTASACELSEQIAEPASESTQEETLFFKDKSDETE